MKHRYLNDAQASWVRAWWAAIHPQEQGSPAIHPGLLGLGRGARAALKRCAGVDELIVEASTNRLASGLMKIEADKQFKHFADDYAAVALVAGAVAAVRDDVRDGRSLAAQLGGDDAKLSELRFLRLMRTSDVDDFYRQLKRAIQLAGNKADVVALANDVIAWCVEQRQPVQDPNHKLKSRWARDYYLPARDRAVVEKSIESTSAEIRS
ncbi:type I-E CRISPR-associated protein Cse2/CasB [Pigmentiphaga aceris]|uniref:Type I-E CRISPR-associated protein Cse2/CasB n=1 Tax=Pigmentiphaga aceris TaxID=1940612 RepID=A0A5C0B131_9BURK|nr:type I-E CRISPR-associated protein Cse2/CasB [Pigmentiphaga aceris]QEI07676.1 type I-E CRISPR-associated protein Cse2/CasB [Pigmentiphaga aceris]